MRIVDIIIATVWIVFWVYWLAASVSTKATQSRRSSFVGVRIAVIVAVLALLRAGVFRGRGATIESPWLLGIGLTVFLLGIAFAVWARRYLGRNWGTPMSEKIDPELVTTGPYRYVRHPIYSGLILGMLGTALALGPYWLIPVVVLGGYFIYSATVEERTMERLFPDTYPAYKRSTKMLIPFVF
jgi:protein-S-isoprenylcysteine O-methyltransferase Ste14